jgi:hypothetical protein
MGKVKNYPPVKYFTAITYNKHAPVTQILLKVEEIFSSVDSKSFQYLFDQFTDYYQHEMGTSLQKFIISFHSLEQAELLPEKKLSTNQLETISSEKKGRIINIDPGYICASKMVLATSKNYDHRLYLKDGIFGDVHYRFQGGQFRINDWTYPDYKQPELIKYFEKLRKTYLNQLKNYKY